MFLGINLLDPQVYYAFAFCAGFCLFYSHDRPTRLGGVLLSTYAVFAASAPPKSNNFVAPLFWVAIALTLLPILRPQWMRKRLPT